MSNIEIRRAKYADKEDLLAMEQMVVEAERPFNQHISDGKPLYYDMEALLTSDNSYLLVAEDMGQIIATGYAQIRESKPSLSHDKHSYLGFMYVNEDYRGKGLNKRLMDKLLEWSKSKGVNVCYLDVYAENAAAIKAYEKAGFCSSMIEMKLSV